MTDPIYASPDDLRQWLEQVEYRHPEVTWELFLHPYEGYNNACLAIRFTVPNAYKREATQTQRVVVPVPPILHRGHFMDWLKWRLKTIALHELNEMFWVDGKPLLDPHTEEYWNEGETL